MRRTLSVRLSVRPSRYRYRASRRATYRITIVVIVVVVLIRSLCTEIPMSETLATDKSPQETDHADGQIFLL